MQACRHFGICPLQLFQKPCLNFRLEKCFFSNSRNMADDANTCFGHCFNHLMLRLKRNYFLQPHLLHEDLETRVCHYILHVKHQVLPLALISSTYRINGRSFKLYISHKVQKTSSKTSVLGSKFSILLFSLYLFKLRGSGKFFLTTKLLLE